MPSPSRLVTYHNTLRILCEAFQIEGRDHNCGLTRFHGYPCYPRNPRFQRLFSNCATVLHGHAGAPANLLMRDHAIETAEKEHRLCVLE